MSVLTIVPNNQVYHHSVRWTVPHTDANQTKLYLKFKTMCDKFIFQAELTINEKGQPNPHYQCYMHTKQKKRSKTLAISINDEFPGIEIRPASDKGKECLQGYCMKTDTRVAGPWADRKIYMGSDLWSEEKHLPWQRFMTEEFEQSPGDRKMYWIYDPVGNNGKTKFIKWLAFARDALPLGYAHASDTLNLVSKFTNKSIYAWNLTRAKPAQLSELDLYAAMESIKDGMFVNTKYETAVVLMDPPHIMVCANHLPKMHHISSDRWIIKRIDKGLIYDIDEEPVVYVSPEQFRRRQSDRQAEIDYLNAMSGDLA